MARTALFAKKTPGGVLAVEDMGRGTGNRWFVDSGCSTGADGTGYGDSPDRPFLTLDYAIGQATANNGDIIYVLPGHSEAYTTTGAQVTFDVAGLTIICLGEGADRPTFTFSHTGATMTMSAASVVFKNFLFVTGTDSVVTYMTVSGADCTVEGEVRDAANVEVIDAFTVTGHRFKARVVHHGDRATGDANNSTIALNSVDGANIYVEAFGIAQVGIVDLRTAASHEVVVNGVFEVVGTTDFSKTVVDTITGSTYQALGFDIAAGKRFSGNSTTAKHSIDDYTVATLGTGAITAAVVATGAIDADAIASNAIAAAKIATGAITADKIAADAITADKIADDAIGADQIGAGAIVAATFGADAITADKIADDAIGADQIADDAITADKIATDAIGADAIAGDAITNAKIADGALASEQFAASAAEKTCDGVVVTRATAALPQTADAAIFTVTGLCLVKRIVGYVTTAVGNVANNTKLKVNPSGTGADTDICAVLDIDNAAVGSFFQITGTFANAMIKTVDIPIALQQATEIVVPPGAIEVDCAGSDGGDGRVQWSCTYVPLESGASIVAA